MINPNDIFGSSPKTVLNKPFMHVQDQKAYNVNGGTSIADAWTTRDLNTVIHNDIQGASLAGNAVTLPAGTYYVEGGGMNRGGASNPSYISAVYVGSTRVLQGSTGYGPDPKLNTVSGVITLSSQDTISLKYYSGIAESTYGLGVSNNTGSITDPTIPSIYTDLKIWQLDRSLEIAPKAVNSGLQTVPSLDTTGNIMGFDISKTGANQLTVTKGSCLDSTLEVAMALTSDTTLTIPSVANTIYHIFLVRLVSGGTFTVKAYTTEAGVASDGTVDKWRWIGFWRTNGSSECVVATMRGDNILFGKASENVFYNSVTDTYGTADHSLFIPESRIELIEYGVQDATQTLIFVASDDGSSVSFCVGTTVAGINDVASSAWGARTENISTMYPYLATRQFKHLSAGSGYAGDLLIHQVKVRR